MEFWNSYKPLQCQALTSGTDHKYLWKVKQSRNCWITLWGHIMLCILQHIVMLMWQYVSKPPGLKFSLLIFSCIVSNTALEMGQYLSQCHKNFWEPLIDLSEGFLKLIITWTFLSRISVITSHYKWQLTIFAYKIVAWYLRKTWQLMSLFCEVKKM